MATHSRILAWKIPWMEESGRLYSSWDSKESYMTEQLTISHTHRVIMQYSCLLYHTFANAGGVRDAGSIPGSGRSPGGGMATHSRILAWRILWTEEPGRLQTTGSQRVGQDWSDLACMYSTTQANQCFPHIEMSVSTLIKGSLRSISEPQWSKIAHWRFRHLATNQGAFCFLEECLWNGYSEKSHWIERGLQRDLENSFIGSFCLTWVFKMVLKTQNHWSACLAAHSLMSSSTLFSEAVPSSPWDLSCGLFKFLIYF